MIIQKKVRTVTHFICSKIEKKQTSRDYTSGKITPSRRLKQATTPWLIVYHVEYLRVATEIFDCWPQRIADIRLCWLTRTIDQKSDPKKPLMSVQLVVRM